MIKCPVCDRFEFDEDDYDFETCEVCEWTMDIVQNDDPDFFGGFNWPTLNQARANYQKYGTIMTEKDFAERTAYWEAKYGKRTMPIK